MIVIAIHQMEVIPLEVEVIAMSVHHQEAALPAQLTIEAVETVQVEVATRVLPQEVLENHLETAQERK